MSRIDFLPEEELSNRLLKLREDLDEIKGLQFLGSDIVRNYRVFTSDQWDVTSVASAGGGGSTVFDTYRLTFTPDTDNPDAGAVYRFDYVFDYAGSADPDLNICRERVVNGNIQTWLIRIDHNFFAAGSSTIRVKFYLFSSAPGAIGVVNA